jgi:hypothetical protein
MIAPVIERHRTTIPYVIKKVNVRISDPKAPWFDDVLDGLINKVLGRVKR